MTDKLFVRDGLSPLKMAKLARSKRASLGYDIDERIDIIELLEFRLGEAFAGFRLRVVESLDGAIASCDIENNCINVEEETYIQACEGEAEARMVLAHELGHFLLHSRFQTQMQKRKDKNSYNQYISNLDASEDSEAQADIFARFFLMDPSCSMSKENNTQELAKKYGMPERHVKAVVTFAKRQEFISMKIK